METISPGSEWRLHRHWFDSTALPDLLGVDGRIAQDDTLYRGHDRLLKHKDALFVHLRERWADLFNASYEVLLYDLTSTYFECDAPESPEDPRRFGHSRDRRSDCVQVIVALVVTPEGLPLAYEMLPGNTADKTTLRSMLELVQKRHGQARRVWVMDRGIPTEEVLAEMRAAAERALSYGQRVRRTPNLHQRGSQPPGKHSLHREHALAHLQGGLENGHCALGVSAPQVIEPFARMDKNLRVGLLRSVRERAPRLDLLACVIEFPLLDEALEPPQVDAPVPHGIAGQLQLGVGGDGGHGVDADGAGRPLDHSVRHGVPLWLDPGGTLT